MSFKRQLKFATDKAHGAMNESWKRSVVQAFSTVVRMTPVDKSYAIKSWLLATDSDGQIGTDIPEVTIQKIPDIGGHITLYSNIPYMKLLEDGSSEQAPHGMVNVVVRDWENIVRSNKV